MHQKHRQDCGVLRVPCESFCEDRKGNIKTFAPSELVTHRLRATHITNLLDKFDTNRHYGLGVLDPKTEQKLLDKSVVSSLATLPFSSVISGQDAHKSPHWATFAEDLKKLDTELMPLMFGASASTMMQYLPPLMVKFIKSIQGRAYKQYKIRGQKKVLYPTVLHLDGSYGSSVMSGPLASQWGTGEASGKHVWLDVPLDPTKFKKTLNVIRKCHSNAIQSEETHLLFLVIEGVRWNGLKPLPDNFAAQVVALCRRLGIPVLADEVLSAPATFGWTYFAYQRAGFGFTPDFVLMGKSLGVAVLVVKLHHDNPFISAFDDGHCATLCRMLKTVAAEPFLLLRASALIQSLIKCDVLRHGTELSKQVPGILRQANLPVPVGGSGFLWFYADRDVQKLGRISGTVSDNSGRMRLPLTTTVARFKAMVSVISEQTTAAGN
jgi:hypothetical protein